MQDAAQVAAAIRMVESKDDYGHQQKANIGGEYEWKVGAYGFVGSRWQQLTEAAGLAGANWQDNGAQDYIAREVINRHYKELGDWGMTGLAFRYGLPAAKALLDAGYTNPQAIEQAGYPEMAGYLRSLQDGQPRPDMPVSGTVSTNAARQQSNPTGTRAQNIVRQQLYALRNAQRGVNSGSQSNEQPVGDSDVPAAAQ